MDPLLNEHDVALLNPEKPFIARGDEIPLIRKLSQSMPECPNLQKQDFKYLWQWHFPFGRKQARSKS
jgi:hypothetical protein